MIELYEFEKGKWQHRIKSANGVVLAVSTTVYGSPSETMRGVRAIQKATGSEIVKTTHFDS